MNIKVLLSATFISISFLVSAQDASRTYAITGDGNGDYLWRNIRQVDLTGGKVVKNVLISTTEIKMFDGTSRKELPSYVENTGKNELVAASAFDKKHNRLFYSTMQTGQLKWIDFRDKGTQLKVYNLQGQAFNATRNVADEAINVTRMCIGADGNGYAISNDGNHLYKFTTGKRVVISDLGNLVDADGNKEISIHNKCTSWGGDMVADAFGKLYIVTATHQVFAVDIETRIAAHIGSIKGLPGTYTTNGAAVDDEGNIVVSSANSFDGLYKVNFRDLTAVKMESSDKMYNASDLANGNLLLQKEADKKNTPVVVTPATDPATRTFDLTDGKVFPNPVRGSVFNVLMENQKPGQYTVVLTDLAGRPLQSKLVTISKEGQAEAIRITGKVAGGLYFVKVINSNGQTTLSERVVINQ